MIFDHPSERVINSTLLIHFVVRLRVFTGWANQLAYNFSDDFVFEKMTYIRHARGSRRRGGGGGVCTCRTGLHAENLNLLNSHKVISGHPPTNKIILRHPPPGENFSFKSAYIYKHTSTKILVYLKTFFRYGKLTVSLSPQ